VNQIQCKYSCRCQYRDDVDIVIWLWIVWRRRHFGINSDGWKHIKMIRGHMTILICGVSSIVMLSNWQKSSEKLWMMELWGLWSKNSLQILWK
jgi:hypothetical protein